MAKATKKASAENTEAFPWMAIIELIMQILQSIFAPKQAKEVKDALVVAAKGYGGTPDPDKAVAARQVLQRAFDETRRVRVFRRATLRWALDEVPPCCNMDKPKLSATQLSEGKELAAKDR
jgi:hypothetical protein